MANNAFKIGDQVKWIGANGTEKCGTLYATWGGRAHVQTTENGKIRSYKMDMSRLTHM